MSRKKIPQLILFLYKALSCDSYSPAIQWVTDKSFEIKSQAQMEALVLPELFNNSKYESFIRQLYKNNFRKLERKRLIFHHEMFFRGMPEKALLYFATPPPKQLSKRTRLLSAPGIVYSLRRNHAPSTSLQLCEQ